MKIYSWNVNGIRAVHKKGALSEFIKKEKPDVFLIQEIKGTPDKFDEEIIEEGEYKKFFNPAEKAGYSGVSVWSKAEIEGFEKGMKGWKDGEGRVARVNLKNNLVVFSVYVPNGGKSEEAYKEKLKFLSLLSKNIRDLVKDGKKVLVGGDFNVARDELDLAQPEKFKDHTHFNPEVREHIEKVIQKDFIDTYRERNPKKEGAYTYWDNFDFSLPRGTKPREVNRGWRLDYLVADKKLNKSIVSATIHNKIMGSDHCPISVEIN